MPNSSLVAALCHVPGKHIQAWARTLNLNPRMSFATVRRRRAGVVWRFIGAARAFEMGAWQLLGMSAMNVCGAACWHAKRWMVRLSEDVFSFGPFEGPRLASSCRQRLRLHFAQCSRADSWAWANYVHCYRINTRYYSYYYARQELEVLLFVIWHVREKNESDVATTQSSCHLHVAIIAVIT